MPSKLVAPKTALSSKTTMTIMKRQCTHQDLIKIIQVIQDGFGKMVSKKKDCIGNVLSQRVGLNQNNRPILVGFKSTNPQDQITAGSHLFDIDETLAPDNDLGYLTSVAYSPMLENYIALGYLKQGKYRKGEKLRAIDMLQNKDIEIEVVSPHFFDPEGERLHG